ncbi:hypothetical protein [Massilia cavernae]|uniref:Uncharacterized protein n=1 Tax=Massilia cavernae TaxID=2320864 RepID=A0A418Y6K8_9BURK|nr:hypothetical protein [Massilia cavernae]RJG23867.1 hypothetical protein D3872_04195 [Massilia cavernae]
MSVKTHQQPVSPLSNELMPATPADVALTRAAYVAARLVIARWQHASRHAQRNLNLPHHESARARWFARTRQGLEEWIAHGGFSQPDDILDTSIPAGCARTGGSCNDAGQCEQACVD